MQNQGIASTTRHRRCCTLFCKHCIKFTSAIILPLLLAIFTVVITLEQRKDSEQQRLEDREMAREQRQQDLNMSIMTRENDRDIARLQREMDEKKREQDLMIANQRQIDDNLNAKKQRNMSRELDELRYKHEREKYFDQLFVSYMSEIGELLEKHNGSLTSNAASAALASAKTLQVLLHIGPIRAAQLIQFLYKANQLTRGQAPLDLTGAPLNNIDLSGLSPLSRISLVGAYLINASFVDQDMFQADFSRTQLYNAKFIRTNCDQATFEGAFMINTDFSQSHCINATFHHANISFANMSQAIFSYSNFSSVYMVKANFTQSNCTNTTFTNSNMSEANFEASILSLAYFHRVNLTRASLRMTTNNNKNPIYFIQSTIDEANFTNATLDQIKFFECSLVNADFRQAMLHQAIIQNCDGQSADFSHANLASVEINRSSLAFAMFIGTRLNLGRFIKTDLSYANLSNSRCNHQLDAKCDTSCEWYEIISMYKTIHCNGSLNEQEVRFVRYVDPLQCMNSSVDSYWNHKTGLLYYQLHPINDALSCVLVSSPTNTSSVSTTLNISTSRLQRDFVKTGDAVLLVRARMSLDLKIRINEETLTFHPVKYSLGYSMAKSKELDPNFTYVKLNIQYLSLAGFHFPLWLDYIEAAVTLRPPRI